jgi:hypothetical protein
MALYTSGGAALTGEADVKGRLKEGYFADLAILSDDFFSVPDDDISHIESVLTLVGGNVVYAAGPFEGLEPDSAPTTVGWSPVAQFGGFHATPAPSGWRQAQGVLDVAHDSNEERAWRASKDGTASSLNTEQC